MTGIIPITVMLATMKPMATTISISSNENPRSLRKLISFFLASSQARGLLRNAPARCDVMLAMSSLGEDCAVSRRQQSGRAILHRVSFDPRSGCGRGQSTTVQHPGVGLLSHPRLLVSPVEITSLALVPEVRAGHYS